MGLWVFLFAALAVEDNEPRKLLRFPTERKIQIMQQINHEGIIKF